MSYNNLHEVTKNIMLDPQDIKNKRISIRYSQNEYDNVLLALKKVYGEDTVAETIRRAVETELHNKLGEKNL